MDLVPAVSAPSAASSTPRAPISHREVLTLAAPAVATSLLQTLVFVVDRAILGHYNRPAIAAMQTAGPLSWTLFALSGSFAVGTLAVLGRAHGAEDRARVGSVVRASLALALLIGVIVGTLSALFASPLVALFGDAAGPRVHAVSVSYLRVLLPALPAYLLGLAAITSLQASGNTRTPLAIGIATNVLNLVLNYALVFGRWGFSEHGATGSAMASAAAGVLEAILGLVALNRAQGLLSLPRESLQNIKQTARDILHVTYGSFGERVVYHLGFLGYVRFVTGLGAGAMAANQALIAIESISFLTADGIAVAAGALVAQRLGAQRPEDSQRAGWLATAHCVIALGAFGLVFACFPEALVRLFVSDTSTVAMAVPVLRFGALAQIPMAIGVVLAQSVRGAGATREALAISLLGALVVRLAGCVLFVSILSLGLLGVWMASTVDWIVRAVVYSWFWRSKRALSR